MNFHELHMLLDYHYWARDRLLDAAERLTREQFTRDLGNSFPSIRDTLVHIYAAEWVWCSRWEGESPQATPDPNTFPDVATVRSTWKAHEERMRSVPTGLANREFIGRSSIGPPTDGHTRHCSGRCCSTSSTTRPTIGGRSRP
jgi:uncharacterized damage-inducible protein DinB